MRRERYLKKVTAFVAAAAITLTTAISASAAESADFFENGSPRDANGQRPGYADLASLPNSAAYQRVYNELYEKCVEVWNSTEDIAPVYMDGYLEPRYPILMLNAKDVVPDAPEFTPDMENFTEAWAETLSKGYTVFNLFYDDNPLFYFLDQYEVCLEIISDNEAVFLFNVKEEYADGEYRAYVQDELKNFYCQAGSIAAEQPTLTKKYTALYKYLCDNMTYSYEKGEDGEYYTDSEGHCIPNSASYAHDIVGPALFREGVCESYARSYELLCSFAGLDVLYMDGMALDEESGSYLGGHAWNYVKLDDGKYYGVDCTFDDAVSEEIAKSGEADQYALNMSDGYSLSFFGDGRGRFDRRHKCFDHNSPKEYGGRVCAYYWVQYEIDNIAGLIRENHDYYVPGDVNCDFDFDMRDLIRLGRYTVDPATAVSMGAANADGTGGITMADAVYLQKSLLGYEGCTPNVDCENYPERV